MMLDFLAELVSIRSLSRQEDVCADFVEDWARSSQFTVQRLGNNISMEYGHGRPRLMLNSHIDTVRQCEGWIADPWTPRIDNGRLIGLGANDAKGCVAAMMLAAEQLMSSGWKPIGTLVLLISAEEEIGGDGGVRMALDQLESMDAAVNGEPTQLAPCTAQRGMLLMECTARGESGHAAHAYALGLRNAIHLAAQDIALLSNMEFEAFEEIHVSRPQVTIIQGGISHNQVPDRCSFTVDLRTTPNLNNAEVLEKIRMQLHSEVSCDPGKYLPVSTAHNHPIVLAALQASGREPYFSNTCSDWNHFGNIPTVKLGPGDSNRSHRPEEFLLEQELVEGIQTYAAIVRSYFELMQNSN